MKADRPARPPTMRAIQRATGEENCPYCGLRMYEVAVKEYPQFEVHLCYACGGCTVFEAPLRR